MVAVAAAVAVAITITQTTTMCTKMKTLGVIYYIGLKDTRETTLRVPVLVEYPSLFEEEMRSPSNILCATNKGSL